MKNLRKTLSEYTYLNAVIIDLISRIAHASLDIRLVLSKGALDKQKLGKNGIINTHGEAVSELDVLANTSIFNYVSGCKKVKSIISEENISEIVLFEQGKYRVAIDPLDGSSNIAMNIPVGTIFAIYESNSSTIKGRDLIASGYFVYGSSTVLVVSDGFSAHEFTLDLKENDYKITTLNLRTPQYGTTYSINDSLINDCTPGVKEYIDELRLQNNITSRYVGSLVADFHRNLKTGGIFIYPSTNAHPNGKLRMLYEAIPLSFIIRACKGKAYIGNLEIMDVQTKNIHERCPLYIGSAVMIDELRSEINRQISKVKIA